MQSRTPSRLANRVLLVGGTERDNSEEATFSAALGAALRRLQAGIPPCVTRAKQVALHGAAGAPAWRQANAEVYYYYYITCPRETGTIIIAYYSSR